MLLAYFRPWQDLGFQKLWLRVMSTKHCDWCKCPSTLYTQMIATGLALMQYLTYIPSWETKLLGRAAWMWDMLMLLTWSPERYRFYFYIHILVQVHNSVWPNCWKNWLVLKCLNHRDTARLNWRSAWRNTLPWMCGRFILAPLTSTSSMPDAEADTDHLTFHHERRNRISSF